MAVMVVPMVGLMVASRGVGGGGGGRRRHVVRLGAQGQGARHPRAARDVVLVAARRQAGRHAGRHAGPVGAGRRVHRVRRQRAGAAAGRQRPLLHQHHGAQRRPGPDGPGHVVALLRLPPEQRGPEGHGRHRGVVAGRRRSGDRPGGHVVRVGHHARRRRVPRGRVPALQALHLVQDGRVSVGRHVVEEDVAEPLRRQHLIGLHVPGPALALHGVRRARRGARRRTRGGGGGRRGGARRRARVVDAGQQPQPVARTDALAAAQRAEPPALQAHGVLLQHGEHVAAAEGQLVGALGHVVVEGARHASLSVWRDA